MNIKLYSKRLSQCLSLWPILYLLLPACTVGPDFAKPEAITPENWTDLPAQQSKPSSALQPAEIETTPDMAWWQQFNDPVLSGLIEHALQENMSLRTASAVLAQSRALTGIAAADQFPMLNANASYTRIQSSQEGILNLAKSLIGGSGSASSANGTGMSSAANGTGAGAIGIPSAGIKPFSLYQYGFDASWELDLWGRVRRELESAEAGMEASREQHHATQLSVIAEVARNYFELRRLKVNRQNVVEQADIAKEQFDLLASKATHGVATDIDVETAKTTLANIRAQIPQWNQQIEQTLNQLSLLLGKQPGSLTAELNSRDAVATIPKQLKLGLPSELAQRRPDIREAEANLHKALANIGLATADFYPRFTLSGSAGLQALRLKDLGNWSALQYALGPSIMLPIFQGGRLQSTLELRQAEHQQAAINYRNTVLSAWHEIDNDLSAYHESQSRQQDLLTAVAANREILHLAQQRFQQGIADFLPTLQAKTTLLKSEQAKIDGDGLIATNLIALYKALGGGWRSTPAQVDADNQ